MEHRKKIQEYGDCHGYSSIHIDNSLDHLILKGGGEVLFDQDINGTNNNEYIRSIVSYEWQYFKKGKTEVDMNDTLRFMVLLDYKSDAKDVRAAMDDLLDFIQTHDSISIHHVVYKLSANAKSDIAPINIYQDGDTVDNETISG